MAFLRTLVHLVEGAGPEAVADGFIGVFDKALVEEERSGVAAGGDSRLAAAFQHGSNAAEVEHRLGALKKFEARTECGQEPGAVRCAAAGESGKERSVGVLSFCELVLPFRRNRKVFRRIVRCSDDFQLFGNFCETLAGKSRRRQ